VAGKEKILIIEDDLDLTEAIRITLEAENFNVFSSVDPEKGIALAQKEKPDLIILDVMFGEDEKIRGFDYAVKMKMDKALAPIPILMVTSVNIRFPEYQFSTESDGEYLPVDDFIDKPAQPEKLVEKVRALLDMKVSKWVNWPNPKNQENKG
jgi:DNA-binding response OmpR family regulator